MCGLSKTFLAKIACSVYFSTAHLMMNRYVGRSMSSGILFYPISKGRFGFNRGSPGVLRRYQCTTETFDTPKLPVTVLSGFLGAGKTTLMQRVLRNSEGIRVAVIVNDMAEVNIDAKLTRSSSFHLGNEVHRVAEKLIEMQNGCICCTLRADLVEAITKLSLENRFDYCLIESTGISDPIHVAETFSHENEDGSPSLGDVASLDTMVTVIDCKNFMSELQEADSLSERNLASGDEDDRTISELLVSQVEFSNVIVMNKIDLVDESEAAELEEILRQLNPDAKLLRANHCNVDIASVVGTGLFNFEKASESPGWLKALNGEHVPESDTYQISSYVYRSRIPFHPERAMAFVNSFLPCIIRSKGFFWLASRHYETGVWSHAGGSFVGELGGKWWAATPKEEWPMDEEEIRYIEAEFEGPWGDRRQELVFIGGKNMNVNQLKIQLDNALLTSVELALGPEVWKDTFEDTFPPWNMIDVSE